MNPKEQTLSQDKLTIIAILALAIVATSCSSKESSLVGDWQSTTPVPTQLSIQRDGTNADGFHQGFSFTQGGQTYNAYWRVQERQRGTYLLLSSETFAQGVVSGIMLSNAHPHKISQLTSNTLVLEWGSGPVWSASGRYEFQRVK
jgi:hypothetical protein